MAPDVERSVKSAPKAKVFHFIDDFLIVHTLLLLLFFLSRSNERIEWNPIDIFAFNRNASD